MLLTQYLRKQAFLYTAGVSTKIWYHSWRELAGTGEAHTPVVSPAEPMAAGWCFPGEKRARQPLKQEWRAQPLLQGSTPGNKPTALQEEEPPTGSVPHPPRRRLSLGPNRGAHNMWA